MELNLAWSQHSPETCGSVAQSESVGHTSMYGISSINS